VDYATIALSTERFPRMQAPNTHYEATATAKHLMVEAQIALEQKPELVLFPNHMSQPLVTI